MARPSAPFDVTAWNLVFAAAVALGGCGQAKSDAPSSEGTEGTSETGAGSTGETGEEIPCEWQYGNAYCPPGTHCDQSDAEGYGGTCVTHEVVPECTESPEVDLIPVPAEGLLFVHRTGAADVVLIADAGTVSSIDDQGSPTELTSVGAGEVFGAELFDVTGDGEGDLILGVANRDDAEQAGLWVAAGDGSGFGSPTQVVGGYSIGALALGDFDGDEETELLALQLEPIYLDGTPVLLELDIPWSPTFEPALVLGGLVAVELRPAPDLTGDGSDDAVSVIQGSGERALGPAAIVHVEESEPAITRLHPLGGGVDGIGVVADGQSTSLAVSVPGSGGSVQMWRTPDLELADIREVPNDWGTGPLIHFSANARAGLAYGYRQTTVVLDQTTPDSLGVCWYSIPATAWQVVAADLDGDGSDELIARGDGKSTLIRFP